LGVSKFEIEVISEIITNLKQYFSDEIYFFSEENHQFCFDINNSKHPVDFYEKKKDIVIEVFGDTFHCNPKIYREDFFLSIKNKFAREIWSRDECVLGELRKQSRNVFVVWEKDWRENKDLVIENIKSKIK
jgi:G:T-mismatch repair DNA endonuclease (very short patch repair protein)